MAESNEIECLLFLQDADLAENPDDHGFAILRSDISRIARLIPNFMGPRFDAMNDVQITNLYLKEHATFGFQIKTHADSSVDCIVELRHSEFRRGNEDGVSNLVSGDYIKRTLVGERKVTEKTAAYSHSLTSRGMKNATTSLGARSTVTLGTFSKEEADAKMELAKKLRTNLKAQYKQEGKQLTKDIFIKELEEAGIRVLSNANGSQTKKRASSSEETTGRKKAKTATGGKTSTASGKVSNGRKKAKTSTSTATGGKKASSSEDSTSASGKTSPSSDGKMAEGSPTLLEAELVAPPLPPFAGENMASHHPPSYYSDNFVPV